MGEVLKRERQTRKEKQIKFKSERESLKYWNRERKNDRKKEREIKGEKRQIECNQIKKKKEKEKQKGWPKETGDKRDNKREGEKSEAKER